MGNLSQEGPEIHVCAVPGCGRVAPYGFGFAGEGHSWACETHKPEVEAAWEREKHTRLEQVKEKMKPTQGSLLE